MSDTSSSKSLTREEMEAYWLPYTGNRQFKDNPRMIVEAKGAYYTDDKGRKIFDSLSSLWNCGAGHNRPEINEAVTNQIKKLEVIPTFGFGHPLAFELANKVVEVMPKGLDHVFFTNSGSEATDTATKIVRAYWRHMGKPEKHRIIGRAKAYHGASWGAISWGGIGGNRKIWGQAMESDHLHSTSLPENVFSKGMPKKGAHLADELSDLVALHDASNIAAVIMEPMMGAGGVYPPPVGYLERIRALCDKHNILLIFDEVITGYGRMGAWTGAEAFGVVPDLITSSKQLINGALPLGAVIVRGDIYQTFMDKGGPSTNIELPHGFTTSGGPLACAASLATLKLLHEDKLIDQVKKMAPIFETALHSLKGSSPLIKDIRNYGLAGSVTIEAAPGEPALRPFQVALKCWEKGFYVRNGGDTLQLGLPFISTKEEIDLLINAIGDSIKELG